MMVLILDLCGMSEISDTQRTVSVLEIPKDPCPGTYKLQGKGIKIGLGD